MPISTAAAVFDCSGFFLPGLADAAEKQKAHRPTESDGDALRWGATLF